MIANPIQVKVLSGYTIWLKYNDGTEGSVNLSHLAGKGVFLQWNNKDFFKKVYIDKLSKSIAWNDTIQLCPNTLYLKLKKITFEEWRKKNEVYGTN